ncbi:kinase-like domain-containing protein [Rhizophagus clarus]|uniref:Kinase-like domain-containing protein n=1 Tax=Rhizophagus clarus TaxID=94130 RepID=A0A8H3R2I3_9GLOM|nr:kinase-like domain-containing protein [Rhizophagus clarus]
MSYGENQLINNALSRSYALVDYNIHKDMHKRHEFRKQIILNDESLTENEKSEAIKIISKFIIITILFLIREQKESNQQIHKIHDNR